MCAAKPANYILCLCTVVSTLSEAVLNSVPHRIGCGLRTFVSASQDIVGASNGRSTSIPSRSTPGIHVNGVTYPPPVVTERSTVNATVHPVGGIPRDRQSKDEEVVRAYWTSSRGCDGKRLATTITIDRSTPRLTLAPGFSCFDTRRSCRSSDRAYLLE